MSDLFDKFKNVSRLHDTLCADLDADPFAVRMERVLSPTVAVIDGRERILLGSNNYLGLTFNPQAIERMRETAESQGVGTTGSRVANGSYALHMDLETQLATFFGRRHAIIFTTGYQANVGFLSAIVGKGDYVLIDSECHASIYDGCRLSSGTVLHFRHNDAADLNRRLARLPPTSNKLVVAEGIYSMRGDYAPLADLVAAAKAHRAYFAVDEAHSLGVLGENGRGLAEQSGVEDQVDFVLGTFSKSVGTIGGFCVSDHPELIDLRLAARAYLFTASLPPPVVAAASATLERVRNGQDLRRTLWRNATTLYRSLIEMGFTVGPDLTPVIGVTLPSVEDGVLAWTTLLKNGVYVNLALPPATPHGICLLRCSASAAHSAEQIETIIRAFAAVREVLDASAESAVSAAR